MMCWKDRDEFGYRPDDGYRSELVAITPATGWFACSLIEGKWYFDPLPMFMTVKRVDVAGRGHKTGFGTFGVQETLGELERVDISSQFMGYAHESDFEEVGVRLKPEAIQRLKTGEFMCGDPDRHVAERALACAT